MEPSRGESKSGGEGNVLAYVLAFEEGASFESLSLHERVHVLTPGRRRRVGARRDAAVREGVHERDP